jgi:hypothetical protein
MFTHVGEPASLGPRCVALGALGMTLLAGPVGAELLAEGGVLSEFTLPDQHGETRSVDSAVRVLLFSRDMGGGKVIRKALEADGAALLQTHRAVYVADVSGMPGLVLRIMAKPSMRRRPYPMLLDEEGSPTADLPSREGQATLIFLEALRVKRVAYAATPPELLTALGDAGR